MAMLLLSSNNFRFLVILLLIEFLLLLLTENDFLTTSITSVTANGNTSISGPFLILERPRSTKLVITKPFMSHKLDCIATIEETFHYQNETKFFFTWFRNGEIVLSTRESSSDSGKSFYISPTGTLRLPRNEHASGHYRCKINANNTAVLSERITVEYPVLKRLGTAPLLITGLAGAPLTLSCPIVSVPAANISWYWGNNSHISLSMMTAEGTTTSGTEINSRYLILANGSLVLRSLTASDGGKIKCVAHNEFAAKMKRQFMFTLKVQPCDQITALPITSLLLPPLQNSTLYVASGGNLSLMCLPQTEAPLPSQSQQQSHLQSIEWWFQRNPNTPLRKLSNASSQWYIHYANNEEHEGYYICALTILADVISTKLSSSAVAKSGNQTFHVIVTTPPRIVEALPSYELPMSASFTFHCLAAGHPRPMLNWYHNGVPLKSSYTRYINGNELQIHSFDPYEDGIYQCFARNVAGEEYSAAEIRFRSRHNEVVRQNLLHNIRCFAHSFNTINVTFESKAIESLFVVHIVQSNPHRWISFAPMKLNRTSYLVISSKLPVYRPFALITRILFPTSEIRLNNKPQRQIIQSSLRSPPVICCTQGLFLHLVHLGNDTLITWSQPELDTMKYFVVQFFINSTLPLPQLLLKQPLLGTMRHVELKGLDVKQKLTNITALNNVETLKLLRRVDSAPNTGDIFNLIVPANVTGLLLTNYTRIKLRVLIITSENENLPQDFRYVQWKTFGNESSDLVNAPFHLMTVESRMLTFHFLDSFNETCVYVCQWRIQFPYINMEEPKCEQTIAVNLQLEIRGLKPSEHYRLNFFSCETKIFYGQFDAYTLPDPPGTISNQRMTRQNGLKLNWDPPAQPNGKIHHYNIIWTLGNVTHETNVLDCRPCSYKFPNITESAKINVSVRVVGETGVGAPIFIDLRDINHHSLEMEHSSWNTEVFNGIAIGVLLSMFCVFCFAAFIVFQRHRFKHGQHGPTHLTSPSDVNFGNLSNTVIPGDSAGGLSGSMLQHDCHEMQTLIPKSQRHIEFLGDHRLQYQTTQLPNGNSSVIVVAPTYLRPSSDIIAVEQNAVLQVHSGYNNDSEVCVKCTSIKTPPLFSSTPVRPWTKDHDGSAPLDVNYPLFIPFKQSPPNVVTAVLHKQSNSSFCTSSSSSMTFTASNVVCVDKTPPLGITPPNTLALIGSPLAALRTRRSGSLSSSSVSSNCSSSRSKQFHTNFPKHSKSNDAICLLAEEESAAALTPTTEMETELMVTTSSSINGCKSPNEAKPINSSTHPPTSTVNNYNNSENKQIIITVFTSESSKLVPNSSAPTPSISCSSAILTTSVPIVRNTAPPLGTSNVIQSQSHNNTNIVSTTTKSSSSSSPTTNDVHNVLSHRRPNIDPNG